MRNPGELRLLVMARLAPVLRHDINNLMTVLKLDLSGARSRARRNVLDAPRITALLDSLNEGMARLTEAHGRLIGWLEDGQAAIAIGPALAEIADLLRGPCALRGCRLGVAAPALERNFSADRGALRMLTAAALLALIDGAWPVGPIELDAESAPDRIAVVIRRGAVAAGESGVSATSLDAGAHPYVAAPVAREQQLDLDAVEALATHYGWRVERGDDELRLTGPLG